ncbi:hypothetical protein HX017_05535 [Myroides marinus]|uniref:Uncharacterized protein n=1 Tax=Myroides marinus TaxID=703342 RepID=A0A161U553_9FLAO|nr:hypothetical protein [Myroides marinus]KZE80486.1 hypothetical protein AV926_10170 [Myroides marinus]MDM1347309.1 hypothetical protein [Myroides marinus]MDM1349629.1 hypothetical protein [Myroides marinus]MDM1354446.1 hypothetical protein [Myroides marinus]MDM1356838.1 hypothetical protein [Myroides marinus]
MILALTVSLFPSCGVDQVKDKSFKEANNKQIDLLSKNDLDGTFFKAVAQDLPQVVSIGKKGIVYSSTKPNQKIIFPFVEPLVDGESRIYKSQTKHEEIEIVIYEDETARDFADGRFDHSVAVRLIKNKESEQEEVLDFACFGHYLYTDKLSGNWIFQSYEDKRVEELGINQIPMICIDINTRSFSGSGGNHMIYGDVRCEGDSIFFKVVLSPEYVTDMYQKEKELLSVLDSCDRFELKEDYLFLYSEGKQKLMFLRDTYNM